jgi:hypothetical protein
MTVTEWVSGWVTIFLALHGQLDLLKEITPIEDKFMPFNNGAIEFFSPLASDNAYI